MDLYSYYGFENVDKGEKGLKEKFRDTIHANGPPEEIFGCRLTRYGSLVCFLCVGFAVVLVVVLVPEITVTIIT